MTANRGAVLIVAAAGATLGLYYVLAMRLGKVLAATGTIAPVVAAWATNGLFLLVGLVFFVRALWR